MLGFPIWGHISGDFCPHQGTKLSWLASLHTREALGWDCAWTRKGTVVTLPGDHIAAPPSALSIGERGPQFTVHAESDIRWPAGSYQSYLFLCNQNNGNIHQPRINTIHLDRSPLWLETRGINSFSIETTTNTSVVLFPKGTSRVFVCGQVCQSICMYQFHSQTCINTEALLEHPNGFFSCTVFDAFLFRNAINMVVC